MRAWRLPVCRAAGAALKGRVSPRGCTPAPHPSCGPLWARPKPAPSGLCGTEFPVGLQSRWSSWRGFRSGSCETPDPESIPAIFQRERGQQLMCLLPKDKNRFKPRSGWSSADPWAPAALPCWPPLARHPGAGGSRLLNGLSWLLTQSACMPLSCRHSDPQTEPITHEQLW